MTLFGSLSRRLYLATRIFGALGVGLSTVTLFPPSARKENSGEILGARKRKLEFVSELRRCAVFLYHWNYLWMDLLWQLGTARLLYFYHD